MISISKAVQLSKNSVEYAAEAMSLNKFCQNGATLQQ